MTTQLLKRDLTRVNVSVLPGLCSDADLTRETAPPGDWAVLLAGGEGSRLQSLTQRIEGDSRPKQFCRLFGGRSLLGHTRERIRPIFAENRTMFVMTKTHETFYREELSGVSGVVAQPANRGTGVAIIVALLRVLQRDDDAVIAFFPSDHYIADDTAFVSAVQSATGVARKRTGSLVLLGARARWPEVEYGWIEPGAPIPNRGRIPLFKVCRFWEKPPLETARELMNRGGLWNTFVIVGHASAILESLISTVPAAVSRIADALAHDDLDGVYRNLEAIDFSKDVLSREPHRLLVMQDSTSGWADLGTPGRVIDTLVRNQIEPEWLSEMRRANLQNLHDSAFAQMSPAAGGWINPEYGRYME